MLKCNLLIFCLAQFVKFTYFGDFGRNVPATLQFCAHLAHSVTEPVGPTSVAHQNRVDTFLGLFELWSWLVNSVEVSLWSGVFRLIHPS